MEDEHHIFVDCPEFDEWRLQAGEKLRRVLEERVAKMEVEEDAKNDFLLKAESFYVDDPTVWPLKESRFYLGHVPKLSNLLPQSHSGPGSCQGERIIHAIYCEWHNAGVRLTSRIYGELQRCVTRSWEQERKSSGKL